MTSLVVVIGRDAPKHALLALFDTDNMDAMSTVPTLEIPNAGNDALRLVQNARGGKKFVVVVMPADVGMVSHLFAEDVQRPGVVSILNTADGLKSVLSYVAYLTHLKTRIIQKQ